MSFSITTKKHTKFIHETDTHSVFFRTYISSPILVKTTLIIFVSAQKTVY